MPTLNYYLNALGRCATLYRSDALEGTGVHPHDMPYLFYICRHPGLSQDALARALYVNKTMVTRRITRLEEEGFLSRTPDPEDKRALRVFPTERAMAVLPRLSEVNAAWHAVLTKDFTPEETERFAAMLQRALLNARAEVDGEAAP